MGTKNNPGQFDCYAAAAPDEPTFTLLGRDRHAPSLVRIWALARGLEGEDQAKVEEAYQCAASMSAYHERLKGRPPFQDAIFRTLMLHIGLVQAENDRLKAQVVHLQEANKLEVDRRRKAESGHG